MTEMTEIGVLFNMINTQSLRENEFFLLNLQKAISVVLSGCEVVIITLRKYLLLSRYITLYKVCVYYLNSMDFDCYSSCIYNVMNQS